MKFSIKLTALAMLLSLTACIKPDDGGEDNTQVTPIVTKTRVALITEGRWQMFSEKYVTRIKDSVVDSSETFITDMEECEKDDRILFRPTGQLTLSKGAMACEQDEQDEINIQWKLLPGESKMEITSDGDPIIYDIQEVSAAIFRFGTIEVDSMRNETIHTQLTLKNVP
ncbi:MAG: hypothetical protein EOP56_04615 [Sphingobacteriales bacterium]|nr:MAG: hypothetical protein EOP56_04615 [Sphingobacteriales bacterium]